MRLSLVLSRWNLSTTGPIWPSDNEKRRMQLTDPVPKVDALSLRNIKLVGIMDFTSVHSFLANLHTPNLRCLRIEGFALSMDNINNFLPRTQSFDPRHTLCSYVMLDVNPLSEVADFEMWHMG